MEKSSHILISGAGVAGLASAIWLGQNGFRPVVVEKAPEVRAHGFLISLSHHAFHFAESLNLIPALQARNVGIVASSYHDETGASMLDLDYRRLFDGISILQIMRDDLQEALYESARDVADFRFSTTVTGIDQDAGGADVTFNDGSTGRFDLVIGADGLHSAVRDLAFGPKDVIRHPLGLCCAAYRLPNVFGMDRKFETHMEKDRYLALFTTRSDDIAGVFVWASDAMEAPAPDARWPWLRDAYAGSAARIQGVIDNYPGNGLMYMDPLFQVDMPCWHKGRVVMAGDAAHCMTLFSGRGASVAFAGACRLARALVEHPVERALQQYDAELRPIVSRIQPATRSAARWYV
ncbi:MAG: FAD-dependent monooxygenase, partial [Alphaproteobacteria bacterium]|nr:FAD-dependent monooxygenase [Alphaproteobacteria bacterium]